MNFYVYMLKSSDLKPITYVGYTNNLKRRLNLHNSSKGAKFTKGRNWKLMYYEKYHTKKEAMSREYYIKHNKNFRNLLKNKYK